MSSAAPRRTQGIARYTFVMVLVLMVLGGAFIYWRLRALADADMPAPTTAVTSGPVVREGAGTEELLQHARDAMAGRRLLAPAGSNAFEFYLAVLKREPDNRIAQDALRETFPFAAQAAEQTIDAGNAEEAQREIDLLTRADPQNYTLTLLRAKLQAQQDAQAQTSAPRAAAPAPVRHEVSPSAPAPVPTPAVATAPTAAPIVQNPVPAKATAESPLAKLHVESTSVEAAPRQVAKPRAPALADATGSAAPVLTRRVEPAYPAEARRARRQGWVDVVFTVQPDGSVSGASVADADPKYVFDRAALAAVSRWQFTPSTQDGKAVTAQVRQRIEFRL
ncbi:energy transducer TonB [Dyella sp. ASV21]|uniref:energy transducer TonB n=1 Tax=Dyella sp. ASV21 TaxID=2795114 RepID=UPI0018EB157F|nr:energy transducer TonB [Dyella sp. ASV21]